MRPVPTLYVERLEDRLRYRLEVPERDIGEPLQEEVHHRIDYATVLALQRSADELLRSEESEGFYEEARRTGSLLYRTLVPDRLRGQLKRLSGPLLVTTSLYGMPWELFCDDEDFWGLRYALGKRLVTDRSAPITAGTLLRARPRALVIGSDARGDLPFVRDEVDTLRVALERFADVTCVSGSLATFGTVSKHLSDGFDLIHYSGHVVADAQGGRGFLLADGQRLSAAIIEPNLVGRPVVFLNACASVRGGSVRSAGSWEETFSGVVHGFLFGGAVAVVGTLCDVSDRDAAVLAAAFYEHVLEPVSLGEALRLARLRCRDLRRNSPVWLSFVLHGNPDQQLMTENVEAARDAGAVSQQTMDSGASVAPRSSADATSVTGPLPAREALITTSPGEHAAWRRLWRIAVIALGLLLVTAGLAYYLSDGQQPTVQVAAPLIIGVMNIEARGEVPDWMRQFTRDGYNTILSKVPTLGVYSRQKIDFVSRKRGLSEFETAQTLGITKMVKGSIWLDGPRLRLEAQVVDMNTGLIVAAETAMGDRDRLIELQNEIALGVLRGLRVTLERDEMQAVFAERTNEKLDSYRLLTETFGDFGKEKGEAPEMLPVPGASGWLLPWPSTAWAEEALSEEQAIRSLLDRYRAALETKSVEDLAAIHLTISDEQREAFERYFVHALDLKVRLSSVDILIEGDEALATFTRKDKFKDARSGREMQLEVRISSILVKQDGDWKIRGLRKT